MSCFDITLERANESRARYFKNRKELLSQIRCAQEPVRNVARELIAAASNLEEAKIAFRFAPRHTETKRAAFRVWVSFCTTLEQLRDLAEFWDSKRGFHNLGMRYRDENPALARWTALSIQEVERASTVEELIAARRRCPEARLYPSKYTGRNPYREATDRLEEPFNTCASAEDLAILRQEYGDRYSYDYGSWWFTAYERAYERIHGKRYERVYVSF